MPSMSERQGNMAAREMLQTAEYEGGQLRQPRK
jgi:hypothetical protein